jgi:hypothetical protein
MVYIAFLLICYYLLYCNSSRHFPPRLFVNLTITLKLKIGGKASFFSNLIDKRHPLAMISVTSKLAQNTLKYL